MKTQNTSQFYAGCRRTPLPDAMRWESFGDAVLHDDGKTIHKVNNPLLFEDVERDELLLFHGWHSTLKNGDLAPTVWMQHQPRKNADFLHGWRGMAGNPITPPRSEWKQLDPAVVNYNGALWLYCSMVHCGHPKRGYQRHWERIGAYRSEDGRHFEPVGPPEGLFYGRAPEVVTHEGVLHLFCSVDPRVEGEPNLPREGHLTRFHHFRSEDGEHFTPLGEALPLGSPDAWDCRWLCTPRIVKEDGWFYMFYCGSNLFVDWLANMGVARSHDLTTWEKSTMNPLFGRCVDPDFGSLWYPSCLRENGDYVFMYEYAGRPKQDRETAYGYENGRKVERHAPRWIRGVSVLKGISLKDLFIR